MPPTRYLGQALLTVLVLALFVGLVVAVGSLATAAPPPVPSEAPQRWIRLQGVATTPTSTSSPTFTSTAVSTDTATATRTSTPTGTATETATSTGTATATGTPTETATASSTATITDTPTQTSTSTSTPTATASGTPTETATVTPTSVPPPAICVLVFDDLNEDGIRDIGEGLLAGALITVATESEIVVGTHTTDGVSEPRCFTSLSIDTYFVREEDPPGYQSTTANTVGVAVGATTVAQVEFGDRLAATPTPTGSPTESPTPTRTPTATNTATETATVTPMGTETATPSATPTGTATSTGSPTATVTGTPTSTPSPSSTGTVATATQTATPTSTATPTPIPTDTPTATATAGPIVARSYLPLILHFKFIPPTITPTTTATVTATPSPTTQCREAIVNGGFEETAVWIFGNTPRPGRYTSEEAYLGRRSVLLGILPPQSDAYSWSSVRQQVTIPANATFARLSFWYKPHTEEAPALNWREYDWADYSVEQQEPRPWAAPLAWYQVDWQEAIILNDQFPSPAVLAILMRLRSNSQAWSRQTHDLMPYAGRTINVYFNAFNNGQGGLRTWMYLDEVSLTICTDGTP